VAKIKLGLQKELKMGNLDSQRDWGYAKEYVEAMWLMLQQDEPGDYVVATGKAHTVRKLLQVAFSCAGFHWEDHVVIDENLIRPAEVNRLLGDASKAREKLGWNPGVSFEELIAMMVESDVRKLTDFNYINGEYKRSEAFYS
jgi:GDPmannose 4,6-dehydratase